jgi:O-antigen ligase
MLVGRENNGYGLTRRTSIFFYAFLVFLMSDVARIQELYPVLAGLFFQKIVGLIAIGGMVFDPTVKINFLKRIKTSETRVMFFFCLVMIISIAPSIYPGNSFRFLTQYFWKIILVYILILAYSSSYKAIDKISWAYILAVGLLGVIYYAPAGSGGANLTRTYDANDLAFAVVTAYPICFFKLFSLKGVKRLLVGCLCLLFLITIIKTGSRSGFIGLLAVTGMILFQLRRLGLKYIVIGLFLCLIGGSVVFYKAGSEFWNRMSTILDYTEDYNYTQPSGRIEIWKRGLNIMMAHPIFGVGVNNFYTAEGYSHMDIGGKWSAAHNSFLQIGVELGFPGLICFCYIILSSLIVLKKIGLSKDKGTINNYFISRSSVISSWIGFIVVGFFLSEAYSLVFFLLVGLSCALRNVASDNVTRVEWDEVDRTPVTDRRF